MGWISGNFPIIIDGGRGFLKSLWFPINVGAYTFARGKDTFEICPSWAPSPYACKSRIHIGSILEKKKTDFSYSN